MIICDRPEKENRSPKRLANKEQADFVDIGAACFLSER